MKINKQVRVNVWAKYDFKCGYCGKDIEFRDMQVDHIHPKCSVHFTKDHKANYEKIHSFDNLMPTCRSCNHYKRGDSLEQFREKMKTIHKRIQKDYISKVALDYGIMKLKPFKGIFFFERQTNYSSKKLNSAIGIVRFLKMCQLNFEECFDGDLMSTFRKYYNLYHTESISLKQKNVLKDMNIKLSEFNNFIEIIEPFIPEKPIPNLSVIKISDKRVAEIWLSKLIDYFQKKKAQKHQWYLVGGRTPDIAMIEANMPYEISIYNEKELKVSFNHCFKDVQDAFEEAMDYLRKNKCYWEHKRNYIELEQFGGFNMLNVS